jgi:class 3 adenylate cyclase
MECGHDLGAEAAGSLEPSVPDAPPEERRQATVLFADLSGYTAAAERMDHEAVKALVDRTLRSLGEQVERFGGSIDKFMGDNVMGVFGAPVAHEDDPERAVRAGLRIVEEAEALTAVGDEPLRLRVGINTGEALVRLGIIAATGEGFLRGDAINTASRLQSAAPEMGVAVGEATYEATSLVFEYEELEPATLKGKSEPVRLFVATAPRARLGSDLLRTHDTPYVGREIDLAILRGVFDKALAASSVQLITVVGEPGIGKSRLVAELARHVDSIPELVTWRQGRCLPYGEGITFWALGEMVRRRAGLAEGDDEAKTRQGIRASLAEFVPDEAERRWIEPAL